MRVLFGAPRKSGNAHLRCLLGAAYDLEIVGPREGPNGSSFERLATWIGAFAERSVASTNLHCSPELMDAASQHGATLIGVIRHPFDLFVSNFDVAQQRVARGKDEPDDASFWRALAGHALEDAEVLSYANTGFVDEIEWLRGWKKGAAVTLRYEQLETDPAAALQELAPLLGALDEATIAHAVAFCPAENFAASRPRRGRRMAALPTGSWRERLPASLQAALRERYHEEVQSLGYEVV